MGGKCQGLYLTCSHLSALPALVLMGYGDSNSLVSRFSLLLSHIPAGLGSGTVKNLPTAPPLPQSNRDESLRTQHSGTAEVAALSSFEERAHCALKAVDFDATVTLIHILILYVTKCLVPCLIFQPIRRAFEIKVPFACHHKLYVVVN